MRYSMMSARAEQIVYRYTRVLRDDVEHVLPVRSQEDRHNGVPLGAMCSWTETRRSHRR
jgi:hypothetical protein